MTPSEWMMLCLLLPLGGSLLVASTGRWPGLRETVTLVTAGSLFFAVTRLIGPVRAGEAPGFSLGEPVPGLPIAFELEPLGLLFALVASGLWILTSLYAIGYMRSHHEKQQTRFFTCFAIAIFAAIGAAFSGNLLTLFLFYEVLTVSTFPLVTHHGTAAARRGGRIYIGILMGTSIAFLLFGVVAVWSLSGTLDFRPGGILPEELGATTTALLLALFAFGTGKAALMPFHRWLPAAMVAPTPVSALLHAVAVVKAGVFTVLKVVIYIFGPDKLQATGASTWLMWVAAFTILTASLIAMTKDNLKARLAYSTISQLSYIVLGAALANEAGLLGGGMHIATHAVGKITLFFCAGAIYVAAHKTEISDMRGIGRRMPVTTAAFLIGALSIIGLPPFGGSWSKWFLALGALDAGAGLLVAVLMISSLLNIAYLMPIPIRGFFSLPEGGSAEGIQEAPLLCVVPLSLTAVGCLVLFFYADAVQALLGPVVLP